MKIILRDRNADIVAAWRSMFRNCDDVEVERGDIFDVKAEALVSPANSYGYMNGGIDAVYTQRFGTQLEDRLQKKIKDEYQGELLVGQALIIKTNDDDYPSLISAPTMRVPMVVTGTVNAYLAFKAALIVAKDNDVESILCPGLGTAVGKMDPMVCAVQMHEAYLHYKNKSSDMTDLRDAFYRHEKLRRGVV